MSLERITKRRFLSRIGRYALGLGSLSSLPFRFDSCQDRLHEDKYLILLVKSSIHEKMVHKDPDRGTVMQFSPDVVAKIDEKGLKLESSRVSNDIREARYVVCQELRYNGSIGGLSNQLYYSDDAPSLMHTSSVQIDSGFPKYRFDGIAEHKDYFDDLLSVYKIGRDGTSDMSLNNERFALRAGDAYTTKPRRYDVEINPEVMRKEGTWRGTYSLYISTSFDIETKIENRGIFDRKMMRFLSFEEFWDLDKK